jgi:hypothetical protein
MGKRDDLGAVGTWLIDVGHEYVQRDDDEHQDDSDVIDD